MLFPVLLPDTGRQCGPPSDQ